MAIYQYAKLGNIAIKLISAIKGLKLGVKFYNQSEAMKIQTFAHHQRKFWMTIQKAAIMNYIIYIFQVDIH